MKRMLSTLGLLLVATGAAIAQAGPSTVDRPCAASRDLVMRDGAVVLTTGQYTYNRYVKDAAYCLIDQYAQPSWVPSADNPQCFIGYRCTSGPNDW
jgi:hypothetical protein